ncbi:MAG TPA: hypothetical protein DCL15_17335 [Chloroflexi bacterium]|nr:hypothetical protein [Chloroflexota bacterium]HHW88344.1 hypothetical protein [Chloroflexota bacterium]
MRRVGQFTVIFALLAALLAACAGVAAVEAAATPVETPSPAPMNQAQTMAPDTPNMQYVAANFARQKNDR